MTRRALWFVAVLALAGCQISDSTKPPAPLTGSPNPAIVDGARGGNPDFFWLWPLVPPPVRDPNYDRGAANGSLRPDIYICALNASSEGAINAGTPCKSGGYSKTYLAVPPGAHFNSADDDVGQYHQWWQVPQSSSDVFYRIRVKVGSTELGYLDVETGGKLRDLRNVNTGDFIPYLDGFLLPIRFRIEQYALCAVPGVGPCGSETINLADGGVVTTSLPNDQTGSVDIPPQPNSEVHTITVQPCSSPLNPRATDLPVFGPCVTVTASPPLDPQGLTNAATVTICDIHPNLPPGLTDEEQDRITMLRYDAPGTVTALPHAPGCGPTVGSTGSLKGFLVALAHGRLGSAGHQLIQMVSPKPLYAAMFLHQGGGGLSEGFSDFQFGRPSKMEIVSATDNQVAAPGTALPVNPTVLVTDLGGDPVEGARVRFDPLSSACAYGTGVEVLTDANGHASAPWTLSATPGINTRDVCGRGVAGDDNNGPRTGVDPFQPEDIAFGDASNGGEVAVLNGSVTFHATGGEILPIGYGSAGWSYQIDGTPPADWFSSVSSPFGSTGTAPFGSAGGCGLNAGVATAWPSTNPTYLLMRRTFVLGSTATVRIGIAIDNDVQVFLDGSDISASNEQSVVPNGDGVLVHENCPTNDSFTFVVSKPAGPHTLAIRAKDRGGSSYVDASVTIVP